MQFTNIKNIVQEVNIGTVGISVEHLKNGKLPGYDGIRNNHIKYGGVKMWKWLRNRLNTIITKKIPS